jgi:hypothetical protein
MKKFTFLLSFVFIIGLFYSNSQTIIISQGFDDITLLPGLGWVETNLSSPVGTTGYFQGNETVFPSYSGAPTSYLGVNFNSVSGANTISNWMISPQLTLQNGDVVSFWTRTAAGSTWPDRLELRLNTIGTSNAGSLATDVGDFTTLLTSVNPTLVSGGYPEVWTQYTVILSGIPAPTTCRIAFRYYVTNGGPSGSNSNYIGIDDFSVVRPGNVSCVTCPPGAVIETETCGTHTNDGYDMTGAMFENLVQNTEICGTIYANSITDRDFDWYSFTLFTPERLKFTLFADNDMHFQLLNISTTPVPLVVSTSTACDTATIEQCLLPGTYAIRLLAVDTSGISCTDNNAYVLYSTTVPSPQFLTAGSNSPVCIGDTIYLWASGGIGFLWDGPDGFSSSLSNPYIPDAGLINSGIYNVGAMDMNSCVNILSLTVDVQDCTSIHELSMNSFSIFPNPADEFITIKTHSLLPGKYNVLIVNTIGQIVQNIQLQLTPQVEHQIKINLTAGHYTVRIKDESSNNCGGQTLIIQ